MVDGSARVYVSHQTEVEILDADARVLIGKIPHIPGVHGIAIAAEFGSGYFRALAVGLETLFWDRNDENFETCSIPFDHARFG